MPRARDVSKPKIGTVTSFNAKRGVGYIASEAVGDDEVYVVHTEAIDMPGYATFEAGQKVEFQLDDGSSVGSDEITVSSAKPVEPEENAADGDADD